MSMIEPQVIFSQRSITKNASIVALATPINLGRCGPNAEFWVDANASGGGNVALTYLIADSPSDTFYEPSLATLHTGCKSSVGTASRDRFSVEIIGTRWIAFKAKELNASPVTLDMSLIISR